MENKRPVRISLLVLLIAALLPYLVICFYALPYADDFCCGWTASAHIPFIKKFLNEYLYWNDRYSADILTNIQPLATGKIIVYQATLFAFLIFMVAVILFFVRTWVNNFFVALLITLLISIFYLCYQPNITDGMYWHTGIANYQLGDDFFLLQFALFCRLLTSQRKWRGITFAASLMMLMIATGFSEVGALLIPLYYITGLALSSDISFKQRQIIFVHMLVALIGASFVFLSPGNGVRLLEFPFKFNFFHSVFYSVLQTIRFTSLWIFSFPFLFLSLLLIYYSSQVGNELIRRTDYRLIILLILGTIFTASFLPYMATGILGQHRTINYVFFYFIFLWAWLLISMSEKFLLKQRLMWLKIPQVRLFLFLASVIVLVFSGNGLRILLDFKDDSFHRYTTEFMQRQQYIIAHPQAPIPPLRQVPSTFTITDAKGDTTWWVDKCMRYYYSETGLVLK